MVKQCGNRGFTLVELMVAVAIVGILAAIAYPAYRNYVMESNRTDAQEALTRLAGMEETWYMSHNAYADETDINQLGGSTSPQGYYDISIANTNCGSSGAYTCFTATAAPVPTGPQSQDTECGSFSIDQNGTETVSGTLQSTPSKCWSK